LYCFILLLKCLFQVGSVAAAKNWNTPKLQGQRFFSPSVGVASAPVGVSASGGGVAPQPMSKKMRDSLALNQARDPDWDSG
jgi:hypothetical protein